MNKRGTEEGIGTTIKVLLILIAMVFIVFFLYGTAWPQVKEASKEIFGEEDELKQIYEDVFKGEEKKEEEEQKVANQIIAFFGRSFRIEDDDCIKEIDFGKIDYEDFTVKFEEGKKFAYVRKKDSVRIYPLPLSKKIFYMEENFEVKGEKIFTLTDGFTKINGDLELGGFLYKKGKEIYFLDKASAYTFSEHEIEAFRKKKICEK